MTQKNSIRIFGQQVTSWSDFLFLEQKKAYFPELERNVLARYEQGTVYPPLPEIFTALQLTTEEQVKVVLIGQDPYHGPKQAHGLSFSVLDDEAKRPPSLRNMFKELEDDLGIIRTEYNLTDWAEQGVLLLNRVLTVDAGTAGSHRKLGWETFTEHAVTYINTIDRPIVYLLCGNDGQKLETHVTKTKHLVIKAVHPSPLAAYRGFFGSKPYSKINTFLKENSIAEINWGTNEKMIY